MAACRVNPIDSSTDLMDAIDERDAEIARLKDALANAQTGAALWEGACQGLSRKLMERNLEIEDLKRVRRARHGNRRAS